MYVIPLFSQNYNQLNDEGLYTDANDNSFNRGRKDSTKVKDKIIPKGLKVWTVDERFGERVIQGRTLFNTCL